MRIVMFHGKLQCVRLKRTTPDRRGRVTLYMHGTIYPPIYLHYLPSYLPILPFKDLSDSES